MFADLGARCLALLDDQPSWATDADRAGHWDSNQSLNGLIQPDHHPRPELDPDRLMIGAPLAIPAMLLVRRFHRHGKAVARAAGERVLRAAVQPGFLVAPLRVGSALLIMLIARMPDRCRRLLAGVRAAIAPITVFAVFAAVSC